MHSAHARLRTTTLSWLSLESHVCCELQCCLFSIAASEMLQGYLAAVSASAYSFVSMLQHFGPLMNKGGASISLTYLASEQIVPGSTFSLACYRTRTG